MNRLSAALRDLLGILVIALLLLTLGTEVAWNAGFQRASLRLAALAPAAFYSDEQIGRRRQVANAGARPVELRERRIGPFTLRFPASAPAPEIFTHLMPAVASLADVIGPLPWFFPVIEGSAVEGLEGSIEGGRLFVNPRGHHLLETVVHELSHWVLFWNLFPGLPMDCCRWFNEGLAECLGIEVGGETPWPELLLPDQIVPFDRLSAAFAEPGYGTALQARFGFQRWRERFGNEGVRQLIRGLRSARPFRSVVQLCLRRQPEDMEAEDLDLFRRQFDLSRQTPERIQQTLEQWLLAGRGYDMQVGRVMGWLKADASRPPWVQTWQRRFLEQALETWRENGSTLEAMGLLKTHAALFSREEFLELRSRFRLSPPKNLAPEVSTGFDRGRQWETGAAVMIVAWLTLIAYRRLRAWVMAWPGVTFGATCPGWLLRGGIPVLALGIAWLIRLLVIGMIPYAGFFPWSDASRILLAEALIAVFLVAFARKIRAPSGRGLPGEGLSWDYWLLPVSVLLPLGWEYRVGALMPNPLGWPERAVVLLANLSSLLASGVFLHALFGRWAGRYTGGLWPGIVYALLRGGLCLHPTGTVLLTLQGALLAGPSLSRVKGGSWALLDLTFFLPHLLLVPAWFVALDPVGGLFWRQSDPALLWIIPVLTMLFYYFWKRPAKQ